MKLYSQKDVDKKALKGARIAVPCGRASPGIAVPKLRHLGAGPGRRQSE